MSGLAHTCGHHLHCCRLQSHLNSQMHAQIHATAERFPAVAQGLSEEDEEPKSQPKQKRKLVLEDSDDD